MADLPSDILNQILVRLPVESLYQCMLVCKSWYAVVTDINSDILPFTGQPMQFLLQSHMEGAYYFDCVVVDDCSMCKMTSIESGMTTSETENACQSSSIKCSRPTFCVVNSCKGLICAFSCEYADEYEFVTVCNPITGQYITPLPVKKPSDEMSDVEYAFGYSSMTNQYKILRVVWNYDCIRSSRKPISRIVKIYTLGEEKAEPWRTIECQCNEPRNVGSEQRILECPCQRRSQVDSRGTNLHSVLHWWDEDVILTFNFESEKFSDLLPPPDPEIRKCVISTIGTLGGCLFLSTFSSGGQFQIWVMKEYGARESWTKEFNIDLPDIKLQICRPLQYTKSGELLLQHGFGDLLFYNPANKSFRGFRLPATRRCYGLFAHTPSLISLKDIVKLNEVKMLKNPSRTTQALCSFVSDKETCKDRKRHRSDSYSENTYLMPLHL